MNDTGRVVLTFFGSTCAVMRRPLSAAALTVVALVMTSCGGSESGPEHTAATSTPSTSPAPDRMSRSEFLTIAGSVCAELALARQTMSEMPTNESAADRATALRAIAGIIDTTHGKMVQIAPSAPPDMRRQFHQSVVAALANMTADVRAALRDYHAGRNSAAGAAIAHLAASERPLVTYGREHALDQCGL